MLSDLFGNKNIERILLFLFVNEKGYATQIQTLLSVSLTPLQKALLRLEKGSIVSSHYEGKTRIYQLNHSFPLRLELESLLKKAYTLLSPQEKKLYCFIHKPRLIASDERKRDNESKQELQAFWQRLSNVTQLTFSAKSRLNSETSIKTGKAEVIVYPSSSTLVFQEKGHWFFGEMPDTAFSNAFRWTLDLNQGLIALEHLRYGLTHPVFLMHLAPSQKGLLESIDSHLHATDTYLGNIVWDKKSIRFHSRIIGPHKNDELLYHYF